MHHTHNRIRRPATNVVEFDNGSCRCCCDCCWRRRRRLWRWPGISHIDVDGYTRTHSAYMFMSSTLLLCCVGMFGVYNMLEIAPTQRIYKHCMRLCFDSPEPQFLGLVFSSTRNNDATTTPDTIYVRCDFGLRFVRRPFLHATKLLLAPQAASYKHRLHNAHEHRDYIARFM